MERTRGQCAASRHILSGLERRFQPTGEERASVKMRRASVEAAHQTLRAGPTRDVVGSGDNDIVYSLGLREHWHMT